jgi:hypothetical protein
VVIWTVSFLRICRYLRKGRFNFIIKKRKSHFLVQPLVLNLFDTHYLPLQAGLRPVMKSFILALLPGLEEETGEFFEKVRRSFQSINRIPREPDIFLGDGPTRSTIWDRCTVLLASESLVNNVDFTICTRNIVEFPVAKIASTQSRRR